MNILEWMKEQKLLQKVALLLSHKSQEINQQLLTYVAASQLASVVTGQTKKQGHAGQQTVPKHHTSKLAELLISEGPGHGHYALRHPVHKVNWTYEAKLKKQAECQPNILSAGDGRVGCLLAPPFSCCVANSTSSNAALTWGARNYHLSFLEQVWWGV